MAGLCFARVSSLFAATVFFETASGQGQGCQAWSGIEAKPCTAKSVSLLQQMHSRTRLDVTSYTAVDVEAIPLQRPFYLKSAEQPGLYVSPDAGPQSAGTTQFKFSSSTDGRSRFAAEDATGGRFYLRSQKEPEMYVGTEGDIDDAHLVWLGRDRRLAFAVERANGTQFFLKSGDYSDSYVQAQDGQAHSDTSLVFAPFNANSSIQFMVENVLHIDVDIDKIDNIGAYDGVDDNDKIDNMEKYCNLPMVGGKHDKVIPDSGINVSSQNPRDGNLPDTEDDFDLAPHGWGGKDSRLNDENSAWLPEVDDENQWIEWDFGELKQLRKIRTLGRPQKGKAGDDQWVAEYNISYTEDDVEWKFVNGTFIGNHDRETLVENEFDPPLDARKVKLHPTKWNSRIALRAEVFGCAVPVTPAPAVVCGACAHCEAAPGEEEVLGTKCPLCAFGMLATFPCNVTDLCRCVRREVHREHHKQHAHKAHHEVPMALEPRQEPIAEKWVAAEKVHYKDEVPMALEPRQEPIAEEWVAAEKVHYEEPMALEPRQEPIAEAWVAAEPGQVVAGA